MGNHKIITILFLALVPFLVKAQDPDWPRFELYQLVQGQDSGIFVITDSDSNLVFTDLLKMRFFPDTALIFNGDTIAVKPDIPTFVEGLGISIEYDPVLNQYTFESLSIEDSIHNGTASLITKGTPLYAAGVQGNYWDVAPADAGDPAKMPVVIIAGEDIAAGENGLGLIKGHIKQVNTTGLASGAEVYVAVGGGYTATKPKGENAIVQRLGTVIKGNSTNGSGIINLGDPRTTSNLNPDKIFIGGADSTVTTINLKTTITDSLNNRLSNYIATGATSGAGISGSATGPASTFTVTSNATTLNTPNTIVYRDGSGNFKAGVIEGNLAGIAREVQSALTPGYGITPSDTYNGSITRTYRIDTSLLATLAALRDTATSVRSAITAGVTGSFINGAVPYSASGGSTLTNSGWSIDGGKLLRGYGLASYDLDVNGSIGGTTLTTTGRINADSILVTKGAIFNTQQGSFNFRVDGNLETGLIFANATTNRVGIGLTGNPNYKLDVNGDVNISSGSKYRIGGVELATGSTTINNNADNRIITGSGTANTLEAEADLTFDGQYLRFTNATTGPASSPNGTYLYLPSGSVNFYILNIEQNGGIGFYTDTGSGTSQAQRLYIYDDGNVMIGDLTNQGYKLYVDGDVKVDSLFYNGLQQLSDKTIKTNIKPIKNQLENITKLNPVSFEFNDKIETRKGQKGVGLIAQELEEIYPNLVSNTREDLKSVSYIDLIPYLISAIQEQQTQIEELKSEVKQLKKKRKEN